MPTAMVKKGDVVAWAGAAGTVVGAVIYLIDFATNVTTLREYYRYEYQCPHAPLASPIFRQDPVCNAIRAGFLNFGIVFWSLLLPLVLAHITYATIFWVMLDPSQHPLRLAYFLPFIHLHRLVKVLLHSFSIARLKELLKSQMEFNSLYNALGVALETTPQFAIQLSIVLHLGEYVKESPNPSEQGQKIPTILLLSLVSSFISGFHGASMALFFLMENHVSISDRIFISILFGIQTLVTMLATGVAFSTLVIHSASFNFSIPLMMYTIARMIIALLFSCFVMYIHYHDYQHRSLWKKIAQTFGLALMTRIVGPTYMLIKLGTSLSLFLLGTILHILAEMLSPLFVLFWPIGIKSPCHSSQIASTEDRQNRYMTCDYFMGITFSSFFAFILTTLLIARIHGKNCKNMRILPMNCKDISETKHNMPTFKIITSKSAISDSSKSLHQLPMLSQFDHFVLLMTILFIQFVQKKYVLN